MAKPLFQDIIPPERKSIRKITRPERPSERVEEIPRFRQPEKRSYEPEPEEGYERPQRRTARRQGMPVRVLIIFIVAIGAVVGTFLFLSRVTDAKIILTPRQQEVAVDAQFTAFKSATATDMFQYQTVTISKDGKMAVEAMGEEYAEIKASGTIVVYNNYSSEAQRLVANTRFETPQGLIFRISQPIVVPGKRGDTPGSIEAIVTADKSGPNYNVGLTDFTIPGFKDDGAKYTKFYARSKVPIQGGFLGTRKKVDEASVADARTKVREELKNNLIKQARKDIPTGYVLPANSYFIEYESLANTQTPSGGVEINERATLHGIFFKRLDLAKEISKKVNGGATESFDIGHIDNLSFSARAGTSSEVWNGERLTFSLKGTTTLISVIDTEKLKNELAGKPRKSLNAVLAGYPSIKKAEVTMRPFWNSVFPINKDEIVVVVNQAPISE